MAPWESGRSIFPCPAGFLIGRKSGRSGIARVAGGFQVIVDPLQGQRMGRHVADFTAFTENAQMDHTLAGLEIAHAQAAQFLAPQPVVQKGGQDRPVALAFKRIGRRRLQKRPRLAVTQGRRFAFARFGFRAFDAADRVVSDRVNLAQVIKERGDRGELAADGTLGQAAALEVFAPGDQVGRVTCRISSGRSTPAKTVNSCTSIL
jgi:hypothetical protein